MATPAQGEPGTPHEALQRLRCSGSDVQLCGLGIVADECAESFSLPPEAIAGFALEDDLLDERYLIGCDRRIDAIVRARQLFLVLKVRDQTSIGGSRRRSN